MNQITRIFETLEYGPAPESPAPAIQWLDAHDRTFGHFIDGKWTKPGKTFASTNPANGEAARADHRRHRGRRRQGGEGRPRRLQAVVADLGLRARKISLRHRPR